MGRRRTRAARPVSDSLHHVYNPQTAEAIAPSAMPRRPHRYRTRTAVEGDTEQLPTTPTNADQSRPAQAVPPATQAVTHPRFYALPRAALACGCRSRPPFEEIRCPCLGHEFVWSPGAFPAFLRRGCRRSSCRRCLPCIRRLRPRESLRVAGDAPRQVVPDRICLDLDLGARLLSARPRPNTKFALYGNSLSLHDADGDVARQLPEGCNGVPVGICVYPGLGGAVIAPAVRCEAEGGDVQPLRSNDVLGRGCDNAGDGNTIVGHGFP